MCRASDRANRAASADCRLSSPACPSPSSARSSPDTSYKYIYFNHMNMALKTTINEARPTTLTREIMRMLSDICDELNQYEHRV